MGDETHPTRRTRCEFSASKSVFRCFGERSKTTKGGPFIAHSDSHPSDIQYQAYAILRTVPLLRPRNCDMNALKPVDV